MDDKGYLRPQEYLFGVVTSILIGLIMRAALRSAETQRRFAMIHLHGPHVRAVDIGEERLQALEVVGYSPSEFPGALALMEAAMEIGKKATVTICTEALPTEEDIELIYLGMLAEGCHLSKPTATLVRGIPTTEFILRKGSPSWALIIPILVPIFTLGLIAFGLAQIETISKAILPIILVSGGLLIVLAVILRKPAEKYFERGRKIPVLPATTGKKALAASCRR